jgi:hypothetical protein
VGNKRILTVSIMTILITIGVATPASALGNNREVVRSCGTNRVASGYDPASNTYWAETVKVSGTCRGRLSVALEYDNGSFSRRVYGNKQRARLTTPARQSVRYGLHWGCDACNVTRS